MKKKKGCLFGVGVGPGDPELMTLKAVRLVNENEIIAVPGREKEESIAYNIAKPVTDIEKKKVLALPMPMTKDRTVLEANYARAAAEIISYLDQGENVVYLTLGDATVYATYMHIHRKISEAGYDTEIISGIPSFCAAAAKLNISLVERSEMLHVIPSSYQIDDGLKLPGTKVLMKAASRMKEVRQQLIDMDADVNMVEKCGMPEERIFRSAEEIDGNAGYLSIMIVKDKKAETLGTDK